MVPFQRIPSKVTHRFRLPALTRRVAARIGGRRSADLPALLLLLLLLSGHAPRVWRWRWWRLVRKGRWSGRCGGGGRGRCRRGRGRCRGARRRLRLVPLLLLLRLVLRLEVVQDVSSTLVVVIVVVQRVGELEDVEVVAHAKQVLVRHAEVAEVGLRVDVVQVVLLLLLLLWLLLTARELLRQEGRRFAHAALLLLLLLLGVRRPLHLAADDLGVLRVLRQPVHHHLLLLRMLLLGMERASLVLEARVHRLKRTC